MTFTEIQELRAKRAAKVKEAREILDRETKENRSLNQDELDQYENIMAEVDKLGSQIEREERLAGLEGTFNQPPAIGGPEPGEGEKRTSPRATEEYRKAFEAYVRKSLSGLFPDDVRALNTGSDQDGGYLVPDEFHNQLIQALEEQNIMRGLATTIQTGSGDHLIPLVVDKGQAQWIGESANYPESDAEFSRTSLGSHKLARITRVTEELLKDSAFNIEAYLADFFRRSFGDAEEKAYINGTGTNQPRGFLLDATVGGTTAVAGAITTDELLEHYHKLRTPYRSRATWMMNDSTVLAIRKLKDANDQYIWQPGLQSGQSDRILGRPVTTSRYMPELTAANAKAIALGDFSYYWIADRQSIGIQRLVELYAAQGQVGFRMFMRVDGRLILPEAVVVLESAGA